MPPHLLQALRLAPDELDQLETYAFNVEAFEYLRQELAHGRFDAARNQVTDPVTAPLPSDIIEWPVAQSPTALDYEKAGRVCLDQGQVAVAILNGGMATRFGGRVKGVVEVVDGLSFLALKLRDIAAAKAKVPIFLLNSFATAADTHAHLVAHNWFGIPPERFHLVTQNISLRLTAQGELYRDAAGRVSFYAPGHGDLLEAVGNAPAFKEFVEGGGKLVAISNVDNLGATLEPRILGAHLYAGKDITVEVASREGGDTGGAPVRRAGKIEVLEGFRFPTGFPSETLPVFNTNTFVMNAAAVHGKYPLTWFRVDKKVGDAPVVQFERLMGEVTSFAPSAYLQIPRQGPEGRFLPVKTPQDIEAVRPLVRQRFGL